MLMTPRLLFRLNARSQRSAASQVGQLGDGEPGGCVAEGEASRVTLRSEALVSPMKIPRYLPEALIAIGLAIGVWGFTGLNSRSRSQQDTARVATAIGAGMVTAGMLAKGKDER